MANMSNSVAAFDQSDLCADPERATRMRRYLEDLEDLPNREFTIRQLDFLEDMREKLEKDGPAAQFTDRQYGWAKGLWEDRCA